jgi:hypothetical protein
LEAKKMKVEITFGPEEFEGVGTSEAYFMFNSLDEMTLINNNLALDIWGVDIFTKFLGSKISRKLDDKYFNFISEEIHINGKTTFIFHNVAKLTKPNGDIILEKENKNKRTVPYVIGGVLPNRNYYDEITVDADELLTMKFDTDDFISIKEYCKDPKKYSYKGKKAKPLMV